MNKNTALGLLGGLILAVGAYVLITSAQRPEVENQLPATTGSSTESGIIGAPQNLGEANTPAPTSKKSTGVPAITVTSQLKYAMFDTLDMVDTTGRPTITGSANIPAVTVIVVNSDGV